LKAVFLGVALILAVPAASHAQSAVRSTDDIIRALRPSANGPARGIRNVPTPAVSDAGTRAATPRVVARVYAPRVAAPAMSAAEPTQAGDVGALNMQVQFATGSDRLSPAAMQTLDAVGKALADQRLSGLNFRIEGHTDTVGSAKMNEELSNRRAAAVVEFIASRHGVDRSRLSPVGLGETQLLVTTAAGVPEARNRRVVVVSTGS